MHRQGGFNLLECLLVLAVIVAVCVMGIHRYREYQSNTHIEEIKSDVMAIQESLRHYYHATGCDVRGVFSGNLTPTMTDLGLSFLGRPPEIPLDARAYKTALVKVATQKDNKPVYRLQVSAEFAGNTTVQQMRRYQKTLGAKTLDGHRLIWQTLPNSTASDRGTKLWLMKAGAQQFRQMENAAKQKLSATSNVSGAYCAQ